MRHHARPFATRLWLLLAVLLAACSTPREFAPPSQETRLKLYRAPFVANASALAEAPEAPAGGAGSGALRGAGQGAKRSLTTGLSACDSKKGQTHGGGKGAGVLLLLICGGATAAGIVVAPFAALVGAAVGAGKAHPIEEVEAAQRRLLAALPKTDPGKHLLDRLAEIGAAKDLPPFSRPAQRLGDGPSARRVSRSVVEIELTHFGLETEGDFDPDIFLELVARARLIRIVDSEPIYWRSWRYLGPQRNYFAAAENDAELLREDIRHGYDQLADRMLLDLLYETQPEVRQKDEQPPGSVWTIDAEEAS